MTCGHMTDCEQNANRDIRVVGRPAMEILFVMARYIHNYLMITSTYFSLHLWGRLPRIVVLTEKYQIGLK